MRKYSCNYIKKSKLTVRIQKLFLLAAGFTNPPAGVSYRNAIKQTPSQHTRSNTENTILLCTALLSKMATVMVVRVNNWSLRVPIIISLYKMFVLDCLLDSASFRFKF